MHRQSKEDQMLGTCRYVKLLGLGSLLFLVGFIQGCHPNIYWFPYPVKAIEEGERGIVVGPPGDCGASGCNSMGYTSVATGFVSTNGPSPVPLTNPPWTCNQNSTKCEAVDGTVMCNARPLKHCRSNFQYPISGKEGFCACPCLAP